MTDNQHLIQDIPKAPLKRDILNKIQIKLNNILNSHINNQVITVLLKVMRHQAASQDMVMLQRHLANTWRVEIIQLVNQLLRRHGNENRRLRLVYDSVYENDLLNPYSRPVAKPDPVLNCNSPSFELKL